MYVVATSKVCKDCLEEKPLDAFNMTQKIYYNSYCRTCSSARSNRWQKENPERHNNSSDLWRENNPLHRKAQNIAQRARRLSVPFTKVDIPRVFEESDGLCGICGLFVDAAKWDLDHVIPLSQGGAHERGNVQVSHPRCNRQKRNKIGWSPYRCWRS